MHAIFVATEVPPTIIDDRPYERVPKAPNTSQPAVGLDEENGQTSRSRGLKIMIGEKVAERRQKIQQARRASPCKLIVRRHFWIRQYLTVVPISRKMWI